ncbi:ATP-grasp domain-containing protein [Yaniella flava]|uniref:ATP-grasp domain-containing protein n=1 Tax=Yaniella flava TaxID=287930 RepID=A0ABN2U9R7_9MICC
MTQNIFVLGLDELGHEELANLPDAEQYTFHGLLTIDELQGGLISFSDLYGQAVEQLERFEGSIDAIVGYWDFPVSMLLPPLCEKYGLRSKNLEAVVKCEHKYWSRLEQQKVITEYPGFDLIDVDDPQARLPDHMSYPAWVKPIKSFSSEGAHRVANDQELKDALAEERAAAERVGTAFDEVLEQLELPAEIAEVSGGAYMVEEAASGKQYTVEGYSWGDQVEIIGVIDAPTYEHSSSFLQYLYPSALPDDVQTRMTDVTRRIIASIGLTDSTFNVEYFWDEPTQRLNLLEINTRHSQSHAPLFHSVDGVTNHAPMVDLALGNKPHMPTGEGEYPMAAKWFWRRFSDGDVQRVPTDEEVATIEAQHPGVIVEIAAQEGTRLSDADSEDSYSFSLAEIFTAGANEDELRHLYDQCREALIFEIDEVE